MAMMKLIKNFVKNNNTLLSLYIKGYEIYQKNFITDETYILKTFRRNFGRELDLSNPITYNEKIQWLKLNDRNPIYKKMVDKFDAREYISTIIGSSFLVPLVGIFNKFDEIDFDMLPNQFVLKCTHDSHSVVLCKDKEKFNVSKARQILNRGLSRDYFYFGREWPYKDLKRRIICEELLDIGVLSDLKVHCLNGKVVFFETHTNRFSNHGEDFYDINWNKTEYSQGNMSSIVLDKPANLAKIVELSETLASNMPNLRVDWYIVGNNFYIGELTIYSGSGLTPFNKEEYDFELGRKLNINLERIHS